jgi:hypothetical protein
MDGSVIITDMTFRKLSPSEGMKLAKGGAPSDGDVYLGVGDSADGWYEITEEEYNKIMAERDADIGGEEASP